MFSTTYRGYTIKSDSDQNYFEINQHGDPITTADTLAEAKAVIDEWLNAR